VTADAAKRKFFLTFAVIGGGFSGVEVAGEINDLLQAAGRYYPTINPNESQVILIHSRNQLLPEVSSNLRDFTKRKMEEAGVLIVLEKRVKLVTGEGVTLSDGTQFRAATVIGTTGTGPHPFVERLQAVKDKGRIKTTPEMRVEGYPNAWAIGDCALIINGFDTQPSPPTGQFAERQGKQCAANIVAVLSGKPTRPFYFKPLGMLCAIGGHNAVAEMLGFKLSGFFAWWLWRSIYLMKVPSLSRKVKVAMDWSWELLFSRDITGLKIDTANRIQDAYFASGTYVFKQGDPAADFYVIETGQVEIMREIEAGKGQETVAVLGPGDFFGEMALVQDRPRNASVRARTDVEVTVIGKGMFARMSKILAPLSQQIHAAIRKRTMLRQELPKSSAILKQMLMSDLMESLPSQPLSEACTFAAVVGQFEKERVDFFCVVDGKARLTGVLTRSDLLRSLEQLAGMSDEKRDKLVVGDIMTRNPLWITLDDSPLMVAEMMRERSLKRLPIVYSATDLRIAGCVRLEVLMAVVMRRLGPSI